MIMIPMGSLGSFLQRVREGSKGLGLTVTATEDILDPFAGFGLATVANEIGDATEGDADPVEIGGRLEGGPGAGA
jgi:hypothetical protein